MHFFMKTHLCLLSQAGLCDPHLSLGAKAGDGAPKARSFLRKGNAEPIDSVDRPCGF
jgi:hypothetical protein